jgi:hypothetical protein
MRSLREPFDRARPDFPAGTPFWLDRSFDSLMRGFPWLAGVRSHLSSEYEGRAQIYDVQSSYKDHVYDQFFYALIRTLKPATCIELGVFQGFSLLACAAALRDNDFGRVEGVDLFEAYPHRRECMANVRRRIESTGLERWAGVVAADALGRHEGREADYLHVDLSNDGDIYRHVFAHWAARVKGVIVLEGGSAARDRVEWMVAHGRAPIVPCIKEIREAYPEWSIAVLEPYPSITVATRRPVQASPGAR